MQITTERRRLQGRVGTILLGLALLCGVVPVRAQGPTPAAPPPENQPPENQRMVQQQTSQGVQVRLEVAQRSIGIADHVRASLTVAAPATMDVFLPATADRLGPFTVVQQTPRGPVPMTPQRRQWRQDYVLAPTQAGALTLPALTVAFETSGATAEPHPNAANDNRAGAPKRHELSTQPVTITVTTVLPNGADVKSPQDIAPPVALTQRGLPRWPWVVAVALAGGGLSAAGWYWQQQRRGARLVPPQPAHVLALAALQRLQQQDLIGTPHIETFYIQLSAIIRRYIEWRFGLRAPEQTTEEFLAVVLASGGLLAAHRDLLSRFLQHCDLVKFARHEPTPDDMQQTFDSAHTFVEQTADTDVRVPVGTAGVEA